jgi:5-methylcytosine-specific restriction endonuclease McrA
MTVPRRHERPAAHSASPARKSRSSRSRRRANPSAHTATPQLTSLPISRGAYAETRRWLIETHGPVCAYCARRTDSRTITLDHVTPRRGKEAYDRRDNLVLACQPCNGRKADTPILAFLFARRERATNLLRFGAHLSPGLRELAAQVAGPEGAARAARLADPDYPYAD